MSALTVYRASAGSGKTFTLAVEYICLLLGDPFAYRAILAVTFTNKATAEMKSRILSQLYGLAVGDAGSQAYLSALCAKTSLGEEEVRRRAAATLGYILHDYSRFHIETLDTFSVSVMRTLAQELSIGSNLAIDLDSTVAVGDAVDALLSSLTADAPLLSLLTDYMLERIDEGSSWRVFDDVKAFAQKLFDETFVEEGATLRRQLSDPAAAGQFKTAVLLRQQTAAQHLATAGGRFFSLLAEKDIAPTDLRGGTRCPATGYFRKLQQGMILDIKEFVPTLHELSTGEKTWGTPGKDKYAAICAIAEELRALLVSAERERRIFLSCHLSLQHFTSLCLLAAIDEQLSVLDKENNRFLLANVNKLLRTFIRGDDTPFVLEKMGTTFRHIMMDEFQDTSRLQWQNFRPLVLEGLAQGTDSLIVGDVKQSIYRWRSGDWTILNSELRDTIGTFPIRSEHLLTNRRSTSTIISFNNKLFTAASALLSERLAALSAEEEQTTYGAALTLAYEDVVQEIVDATPRGYVRLSFLPSKDEMGTTYENLVLQRLEMSIATLLARGVRQKDIAILVRRGSDIKTIADYFCASCAGGAASFSLVSDEAYRLSSSPAVTIIIHALRCLTLSSLTADDSRLYVATLAVAYANALHPVRDLNSILLAAGDELLSFLPAAFVAAVSRLSLMPLYEVVEQVYALFHLSDIPAQDGYMCAFLDAVAEYSSNHSSDLAAFLTYWDETLSAKTIPMGAVDGIRILTIHKAKGLEFHSVLLPFCDWSLEVGSHHHAPQIWCHPTETPFSLLDLLPIEYGNHMRDSIYHDAYRREQLQLWVDNLNLLYVACTRAKENLYIYCQQASKDKIKSMKTVATLLAAALGLPADATHYEEGELREAHYGTQRASTNRLLLSSRPVPLVATTGTARFAFRQSNRAADFFSTADDTAGTPQKEGVLLHHLFENIGTRGDVSSAVALLREEGLLATQEEEERVQAFAVAALDRCQHKEWYDGSWTLLRERSLVFRDNGTAATRRPDRLMMKENTVVVMDYKFGEKRAAHRQQVLEYMQLIKEMGYANVQGYVWYVPTNELEEVVDG